MDLKYATESAEVVAVKYANMTMVGMYLRLMCTKNEVLHDLNQTKSLGRGTILIIGDLNARRKSWNSAVSSNGKALSEWCRQNHFSISAPSEPTFHNHNGTSTVDLVAYRAPERIDTHVVHGTWFGVRVRP